MTLLRILAVALLAAILTLLAGCGGGEDLEDEQPTPPVPCSVDRKACI